MASWSLGRRTVELVIPESHRQGPQILPIVVKRYGSTEEVAKTERSGRWNSLERQACMQKDGHAAQRRMACLCVGLQQLLHPALHSSDCRGSVLDSDHLLR